MQRLTLACAAIAAGLCLSAAADEGFSKYAKQVLNTEPNLYLQELGKISDREGSLARTYLSPAHKRAAAQLKTWMEQAGMEAWVDGLGNVHGRVNGSDPAAPAILIGSHYDTVYDGGNYDGTLGIIVGISAIKATVMKAALQAGAKLPELPRDQSPILLPADVVQQAAGVLEAPMHLVAFADEEGVRFQSTFLGSRALAGKLVHHNMLAAADKQGNTLEQVLKKEAGMTGDIAAEVQKLALSPESIDHYVEVHIEQGPVLEQEGRALAVVSAIAGQSRMWVTINGTQGHAGTVPMVGRKDALAAAAAVVLAVESTCNGGPKAEADPDDEEMLVCTVGELQVWPGASNVIAGQVQLSVDVRSKSDENRKRYANDVMDAIIKVCNQRHVDCQVQPTHSAPSVHSDGTVMTDMLTAIQESQALLSAAGVGCGSEGDSVTQSCPNPDEEGPAITLVSGAGHDALAMAEVTKVAMMFVRCRGGVSHSPLEYTSTQDVAAAAAALTQYLTNQLIPEPLA